MPKKIDIVGKLYGRLTVLRRDGNFPPTSGLPRGAEAYICECVCGNEIRLRKGMILSGNTRSCGCLLKESRRINNQNRRKKFVSPGQQFGRLTVVEEVESDNERRMVLVFCACSPEKKYCVQMDSLTSGNTESCGCLRIELLTSTTRNKRALSVVPGQQFGRLTAVEERQIDGKRKVSVFCSCDPSKFYDVFLYLLVRGTTNSCGCINAERLTTHGFSKDKIYAYWECMTNLGSVRCAEWASAGVFIKFMKQGVFSDPPYLNMDILYPKAPPGYQLCRINPKEPWGPNNVQWMTDSAKLDARWAQYDRV